MAGPPFRVYIHCLSAQERLQCRGLFVSAVKVLVRGMKIVLAEGAIRLPQRAIHPVHRSENVAPYVKPLCLLLAANLLHAAARRIRPRIQVHQPVMCLANFLR